MKVKVIFLDYLRHDFTERVKKTNFYNAGYSFDYIQVNMQGISAALNYGIDTAKNYDAVVTMANDILMPDNWLLRMVQAAEAIPETGMCGIHVVEGINPMQTINGIQVHVQESAFGNVLIPMKAINKIGYFNPVYDPYGMQDSDYAFRLRMTGHINYYLHDVRAEHIGHDVGQDSDYRRMKDAGLRECDRLWLQETTRYQEANDYTIFLKDTL